MWLSIIIIIIKIYKRFPLPRASSLALKKTKFKAATRASGLPYMLLKSCGVTVVFASLRFGHLHSKNPSDVGIPCNPNPNLLTEEKSDSLGPKLNAWIYGIFWGGRGGQVEQPP